MPEDAAPHPPRSGLAPVATRRPTPTAPEEARLAARTPGHVAAGETIGLGFGKIVADGSVGTIIVLLNPIYNMTLGVNPALLSMVSALERIWDAMLDPVAAQFSDNFRSRWGRRRPLMLVAILPLAVLFALLWWFPRGASAGHLFTHLLVVSLLFYVAHSLYAMAYGALLIEATDDYHQRTRVAGLAYAFVFVFGIASQWFFPLTQLAMFGDTVTGLRWVATGCALLFLIAGVLPVLLCREPLYAKVAARQPRVPFWTSLRAVSHSRPFLVLLGARFAYGIGYNLVGVMFLYMNNYYVFGGDLKKAALVLGTIGSAFQVSALLSSLFLFPWLARRIGKRRVFQVSAGVLMLGCVAKLFVYHPEHPWLQLIVLIANGTSTTGMVLMMTSMLGDIADHDEWCTGIRREGLFVSVCAWVNKAANSIGTLVTGFLLVWIGFDAKHGVQSASTLELMKICYFAAPFAGALAALMVIQRYDLDESKVSAIKEELVRRRASAAQA